MIYPATGEIYSFANAVPSPWRQMRVYVCVCGAANENLVPPPSPPHFHTQSPPSPPHTLLCPLWCVVVVGCRLHSLAQCARSWSGGERTPPVHSLSSHDSLVSVFRCVFVCVRLSVSLCPLSVALCGCACDPVCLCVRAHVFVSSAPVSIWVWWVLASEMCVCVSLCGDPPTWRPVLHVWCVKEHTR